MQVDEGVRPAAPRHPHAQFNRRKFMVWPTTSTIIEVIPEMKLAFRVNANNTVWSYELEPTDTGTRELVDGMNATRARIKAAAES